MAAKFSLMKAIAAVSAVGFAFATSGAFAVGTTWTGASGGSNSVRQNWFTTSNWSPSGPPGAGASVTFGTSSTPGATINLNSSDSAALASITITGSAPAYSFGGSKAVVLDGALVNDRAGVKFNNLNFAGNSTISGAGTTEIFLGANADPGVTVTVTGHELLVDGATATIDMVINNGGILKATNGATLEAATIGAGGTLSGYGNGSDYMTGTVDDLTFSSPAAIANVFVSGANFGEYDAFGINNSVTFNGTLNVDWAAVGSTTFANYTTFNLFNGGTASGNFTSANLLGATGPYSGLTFTQNGGEWVTQTFTGDGGKDQWLVFQSQTGNLVVVPEPSTMVFAGVGVAMAGWSAWKKRRLAKVLAKK